MIMNVLGARLPFPAVALSTAFAVLSVAAPARAEVTVSYKVNRYEVGGATAAEVREQMIAKGPRKGDRPMYGFITYNTRWSFRHEIVGGKCAATDVKVTITIAKTVPELRSSDAALKSQFAIFRKRLDDHEEQHANNGRSMARRMDRGIAAMPPAATCEELKRAADALFQKLGSEANAADQEYDRRTGHGRTEGVIWTPQGLGQPTS